MGWERWRERMWTCTCGSPLWGSEYSPQELVGSLCPVWDLRIEPPAGAEPLLGFGFGIAENSPLTSCIDNLGTYSQATLRARDSWGAPQRAGRCHVRSHCNSNSSCAGTGRLSVNSVYKFLLLCSSAQ